MSNKNIQFYNSVQNIEEWSFIKEKKERIKQKTQKNINSQIYLSTFEEKSVYIFLFFLLAPEQAFEYQLVSDIIKKLKGQSSEQKKQYEQCKKMIHINWDGTTPLTHLIKRKRKDIIREQKYIHSVAQRITGEEAKQILKSSLSQRKLLLEYYTNDGKNQQSIIPTIQDVNNYVAIVYNEHSQRYLISVFSHSQAQQELKEQQQNHTFVNRPINPNVVNPDQRPLPAAQNKGHSHSHHTIQQRHPVPTQPRHILDPDQKLLNPPPSIVSQQSNANEHHSKNMTNPDDRLLPFPPKADKSEEKKRKLSEKLSASHVKKQLKQAEEKVKKLGKKTQEKAGHLVDQLKKNKFFWMEFGITAFIILGAIKILRT